MSKREEYKASILNNLNKVYTWVMSGNGTTEEFDQMREALARLSVRIHNRNKEKEDNDD